MALVFLFALASIGLMLAGAVHGALTFGTVLALGCFVAMAAGVFVAVFRMSQKWETEDET